MFKHAIRFTALAGFVLWTGLAKAFIDPPYITPEHPTDGQPMAVNMHVGNCDSFANLPGFPRVTQVGNDIKIVYFTFHSDDIEFCNFVVATAHFPIDGQAPGAYSYTIARVYIDYLNHEVEETIGVVPVVVLGGAVNAEPAPTLGNIALIFMAALLTIAALRHRAYTRFLLVALALQLARPSIAEDLSIYRTIHARSDCIEVFDSCARLPRELRQDCAEPSRRWPGALFNKA